MVLLNDPCSFIYEDDKNYKFERKNSLNTENKNQGNMQ